MSKLNEAWDVSRNRMDSFKEAKFLFSHVVENLGGKCSTTDHYLVECDEVTVQKTQI